MKIKGEQDSAQHYKAIADKESYIADLLTKLKNDESGLTEKQSTSNDDFGDMDSMEGGLVDVRNQVELAAEMIKVKLISQLNTNHKISER